MGYSKLHSCSDCTHDGDRTFTYPLNIQLRISRDAEIPNSRELVSWLMEELVNISPGWVSSREGAEWHITKIIGAGGTLFEVDEEGAGDETGT